MYKAQVQHYLNHLSYVWQMGFMLRLQKRRNGLSCLNDNFTVDAYVNENVSSRYFVEKLVPQLPQIDLFGIFEGFTTLPSTTDCLFGG